MGTISKKLRRRLGANARNLPTKEPKRRPGELLPGGIKDVRMLIQEGLDPIHAAYAFMQQMSSHFAELVSRLPELKAYAKLVGAAEDEYLPSGPPMSPLTTSYFTCWAFYDLQFGPDCDTIAGCQIESNDIILLNSDQLEALQKLSNSRMGIYEHVGLEGPYVRLRELITGDEFVCYSTSGYTGRPGELWYVRLLPPLLPEVAAFYVVFTTPYVLIETSRDDWGQFLQRSLSNVSGTSERLRLHSLFKYGPSTNFWNEFVFAAYHHHQTNAIFLSGIPDLRDTLPHA